MTEDSDTATPLPPVSQQCATTAKTSVIWPNKKAKRPRQLGVEPPIHALILGGTFSLGILLWIGAAAIAIVSAVRRSDFKDADLNDFEYLGPTACRIERAVNYRVVEEEVNALNTVCLEQWEYRVHVQTADDGIDDVFRTDWLSLQACQTSCYLCPESRLYGRDHYAGVDVLRRGQAITNETLVECWGPRIPVSRLSDFYNCGPHQQNSTATSCYVLADPRDRLKDELDSYELSMLGAYVGFGCGAFLLLVFAWCVWHNRRVLARDREILDRKSQQEPSADEGGEDAEA